MPKSSEFRQRPTGILYNRIVSPLFHQTDPKGLLWVMWKPCKSTSFLQTLEASLMSVKICNYFKPIFKFFGMTITLLGQLGPLFKNNPFNVKTTKTRPTTELWLKVEFALKTHLSKLTEKEKIALSPRRWNEQACWTISRGESERVLNAIE